MFWGSGSRISVVGLYQNLIFRKFLKGGRKMTKVDLSKPNVPNQAPKWLGEYGKRLYPKLATYLNKNDKILRADEYLLHQYCSAYDVSRIAFQDLHLIDL